MIAAGKNAIHRKPVFLTGMRLAAGVLILNAFMAVMIWVSINHSRAQYEERAAISTRNLALVLEQSLSALVDKIDLDLLVLADEAQRQVANGGIDKQTIDLFITRQLQRLPEVEIMRMSDSEGEMRYGIFEEGGAGTVADREYFIKLRDDPRAGLVITKPVIGRISKKWVLIFARRYNNPDGSFAGALWGAVTLDFINKKFSAIDVGRDGVVSLRSDKMELITRFPQSRSPDVTAGSRTVSPELLERIEAGQTEATYYTPTGADRIPRLVSFRKIDDRPLYIIVGRATDELLAAWREQSAKFVLMGGVFALLTITIAWLIHRDGQKRLMAQEALRENEEKFRTVADFTSDWEYWIGRDDRLVWVSPSCERITGYAAREFLDDPELMKRIVYPEDATIYAEHLRTTHNGGDGPCNMDFRIVSRSDNVVWINHTCAPVVDAEGKSLGRRACNRDVTERINMQKMMIQNERMMSVGGLAAGVAHEINNPLAGMLQSAQVIASRLSPDVAANLAACKRTGCEMDLLQAYLQDRKIPDLLDGIRDSGRRANSIVSNILEFSASSTSALVPTDLNAVVEKAIDLCKHDSHLRDQYDLQHITIKREFELQDLLAPCFGNQIQQVVFNLLRNAAQVMAEAQTRDPTITLRTRNDGKSAIVEVEDNGPGMEESVRKHVFEPFFTTKRVGKGTGLGLSVSYFIVVNRHHGTIEVQSSPGQGTKFVIKLPLRQASQANGMN
jgi:PAS domain S-box-containing protein